MVIQDLFQEFGVIVEGKADMPYLSFGFQLLCYLECVGALILVVIITGQRMHQVKIEVVHAAGLELFFKQRTYIFFRVEAAVRQFVRKHERFAGISRGDAFFDHPLARAAVIDSRGIKIIETRFHELVHHLVTQIVVDVKVAAAFERQSHAA